MKVPVIALIGPKGSGKTTVANALKGLIRGSVAVSTSSYLRSMSATVVQGTPTGQEMAELGRAADEDNSAWILDAVVDAITPTTSVVIVDAVRTYDQLDELAVWSERLIAVWVHCSNQVELTDRLMARGMSRFDIVEMRADITEAGVPNLASYCMAQLDTADLDNDTLTDRLAGHVASIAAYQNRPRYDVHVVFGGQYGSEGKGNVVAWYAAHGQYDWLVRTGGANAGHTVWYNRPVQSKLDVNHASIAPDGGLSVGYKANVTADPVKVVFHHIPSGSLHKPNANIVLGPGAVIRVDVLLREITACEAAGVPIWDRLHIAPNAFIVTDLDVNNEQGDITASIGSTGQGVGSATQRRIGRDPNAITPLDRWLEDARDGLLVGPLGTLDDMTQYGIELAMHRYVESLGHPGVEAPRYTGRVMLEGTQGFGLSIYHGHYPYTTSRDTGVAGLLSEAGLRWDTVSKVTAVFRTFPIRVQSPAGGTSGPLHGELDWDDIAAISGRDAADLRRAETTTTTKRQRRVGRFDWDQLRTTCRMNGVTHVVLSFADYFDPGNANAKSVADLDETTKDHLARMWTETGATVDGVVVGPHVDHVLPVTPADLLLGPTPTDPLDGMDPVKAGPIIDDNGELVE